MAGEVGSFKKYEFDVISAAWIKKSLESQRAMLIRNRNKEMAGSEVWVLRGKEIDQLNVLIQKM